MLRAAPTGWRAHRGTSSLRTTSPSGRRPLGFDVSTQEFEYDLDFLADFEAPVLSVVGGPEFVAGIAGATLGGDFGSMFKSTAYGTDITAPVWAIDLVLPPGPVPNTSTSGCEAADYAGVPAGAIILVQRGTCTFAQKFTLADASAGRGDGVHQRGPARPDRAVVVQLRRAGYSDVRRHGRHRDDAVERRAERRHRADSPVQDRLAPWHVHHAQRDRRDDDGRCQQRDRGRGAPRLGRRGPGYQRQRLRFVGDPRDRRADDEGEPAQQGAIHLVRRRGVRVARLGGIRGEPDGRASGHRSRRC